MKEIKQIAQQNQSSVVRHWNLAKGGNTTISAYYHSFGNFIKHDLSKFDPAEEEEDTSGNQDKAFDYPIDLLFLNRLINFSKNNSMPKETNHHLLSASLSPSVTEKLPHSRMVFKDKCARDIAVTLLCLYIKYS